MLIRKTKCEKAIGGYVYSLSLWVLYVVYRRGYIEIQINDVGFSIKNGNKEKLFNSELWGYRDGKLIGNYFIEIYKPKRYR